jgi:hypothetical protein
MDPTPHPILSEETQFKMQPSLCPMEEISCSDDLCPRKITLGNPCYFDLLKGKFLCIHCGQCLRYARKKAVGRGEPIESAEV